MRLPIIVTLAAILTFLSTNIPPKVSNADSIKTTTVKVDSFYKKQPVSFPDRTIEYTAAKQADNARLEAARIAETAKVVQTPAPAQIAITVPVDTSDAKLFIYNKESGNQPCKINGGAVDCSYQGSRACGIGQALPCSKLTNVCALADYACQDAFFTKYAMNRYGSWENAKAFWLKNSWW